MNPSAEPAENLHDVAMRLIGHDVSELYDSIGETSVLKALV